MIDDMLRKMKPRTMDETEPKVLFVLAGLCIALAAMILISVLLIDNSLKDLKIAELSVCHESASE